jgi:hypothetical protein
MKVLESQNDEFVFAQMALFGEHFRERRAKPRQAMLRHQFDK